MAQTTSELWNTLWNTKNTNVEYAFDINGVLYDPESDAEVSHSVDHSLFDEFGIGNVTVAKLSLQLYADNIPRSATVKRYARLVNGDTASEWLPKGVFFVSRRAADEDLWSIDAYDALRKAEVVWEPDQSLTFPMAMPDAVGEFCRILGVELDERTVLNSAYTIDYPANEYTIRKELGFIAAAHGGNWIMTDEGRLWLVPLRPSGTAHEVGLDLVSLNDNGLRPPVSRVTLWSDDENCYTSGDDTGLEIVADCPHATQAIVDALAAALVGYEYQAYTAGAVEIDPATELGDPVVAGDMTSFIAAVSDKGNGYPDISAPGEQEMDDEYPDTGPMTQEFNRQLARTRSAIKKTASEIKLLIESEVDEYMSSEFSVTLDAITAEIFNEDGSSRIDQTAAEIRQEISGFINEESAQSLIDQTLEKIELSVSSANGSTTFTLTNDGAQLSAETLELSVNAVNVYGKLTADQIDATELKVDAANITGTLKLSQMASISFGDLSDADEVDTAISDAYDLAYDAYEMAGNSLSEEEVTTLITSTLVQAPTIKGGEFYDLNEQGRLTLTDDSSSYAWLTFESVDGSREIFSVGGTDHGGTRDITLMTFAGKTILQHYTSTDVVTLVNVEFAPVTLNYLADALADYMTVTAVFA